MTKARIFQKLESKHLSAKLQNKHVGEAFHLPFVRSLAAKFRCNDN